MLKPPFTVSEEFRQSQARRSISPQSKERSISSKGTKGKLQLQFVWDKSIWVKHLRNIPSQGNVELLLIKLPFFYTKLVSDGTQCSYKKVNC